MNFRHFRAVAAALVVAVAARGADSLVYAGAATGIYGYRFDSRNVKLKALGQRAVLPAPAYLLEHPDHRYLYAASGDLVSAFLIDPKTGKLTLVNQASSGGAGPCHLALDREGRWLAVANAIGGSVAIMALRKDGGVLQASVPVHPAEGKPQPRSVLFSADNRFLLVADFGLDRIYVYRFNVANGSLTPAETPYIAVAPGAGVHDLAFHPNGRVLFATSQVRPAITAYHYNPPNGDLSEVGTAPLAASDAAGAGQADGIALNAAGTVAYTSLEGAEGMALFVVDPVRFSLSLLEITPLVGSGPFHFAMDPAGAYLAVANQGSGNLTLYTVHPHTGQLRPAGRPPVLDRPACVVFVPAM